MADSCFTFLLQYPSEVPYFSTVTPPTTFLRIDTQYAAVTFCGYPELLEENYVYGAVPKCYGLATTEHLTAMGINRVESIPGLDLFGQGVLIGMVDTGIDYRNSVFRNADGSTRIEAIWDQTLQASDEPSDLVPGVGFGAAFDRAALENGTPDTVDENGHGTFLASVMCGNAVDGYRGVAPEAGLVCVKLRQADSALRSYWRIGTNAPCYSEADIMLGIQFLVQTAELLGRPIVILISLESNSGGHNGESLLDDYLDNLSRRRGIGICVSAGNEANAMHHYRSGQRGIEEESQPATAYDEIQFQVEGTRELTIEFWSRIPELYSVNLISPGGLSLGRVSVRSGALTQWNLLLEGTNVVIDYQTVELRSMDELILLKFRNMTDGIWTLQIYPERIVTQQLPYDLWLPITAFMAGRTVFLRPNPDVTISAPGNAALVATISAYDTFTNSIVPESGRGYTRSGQVKPDLAAPGAEIPGISLEDSPPGTNTYVRRTGTSIAAANAAGCMALLFEWGVVRNNMTYMTGTDAIAILISGAVRDDRGYPNREWGYGKVDLYGALAEIR